MMLASTMQFSRYGRYRAARAIQRDDPVLAEKTATAVPSGPNSVLGPCVPWAVIPCHSAPRDAATVLVQTQADARTE
jgi:hypothetical protein